MVSTKTKIGTYEFENCFMNAAGVYCYDRNELEKVINSEAGTFVTKTATLNIREGNPTPRYHDTALGCINSMGLPNLGFDYYLNYLLELQETMPNRTFFFSLVGLSPEETHTLLKRVQESDFNGLTELNLVKPIASVRSEKMEFKKSTVNLLKIHGSLTWKKSDDNIARVSKEDNNIPIMIFPSSNKYTHSYEKPYFELFSKFQEYIKRTNTLLITTGFSFADNHIAKMITQAIKTTSSLTVLITDHTIDPEYKCVNWKALEKKIRNFIPEEFYTQKNNYFYTSLLAYVKFFEKYKDNYELAMKYLENK